MQLMEVAKQVASKQSGLRQKISQFSYYSLPNTALNDDSLDSSMFRHKLFLKSRNKK